MSENVFTDDDLKRLNCKLIGSRAKYLTFPRSLLLSIVNRLRCSENNMADHSYQCVSNNCVCTKKDRLRAWRAAAGK